MKKKLILLILLILPYFVFAKEYKIMELEYTDEYREWIKLKTKNDNLEPVKYKINTIGDNLLGASPTQSSYSLVDDNLTGPVRNQEQTDSCWAFASTDAIKSNLLTTHRSDTSLINKYFSPVHLELTVNTHNNTSLNTLNRIPYNRNIDTGGNYYMTTSYLLNLRGPIYENEYLKWGDYKKFLKTNGINTNVSVADTDNDLNFTKIKTLKPDVQVKGIANYMNTTGTGTCTTDAKSTIKNLITTNGAVASNIYLNNSYLAGDKNQYYNYDGEENPNHGVLIVGWNDDIEVTNFNSSHRPTTKGAWIVKNSYGTSYGDNGYYYVSYEDKKICYNVFSFYDVTDKVSDKVYYYDELYSGVMANITTSSNFYLANKFKRSTNSTKKEKIDYVTINMPNNNVNYNVYYSPTGALNNLTKVASGTSTKPGYQAIAFDEDKQVVLNDNDSEDFAIVYELLPEGNTTYNLLLYGKIDSSSILASAESTPNVSYAAVEAPVTENWSPLINPANNEQLNNTIRVYTSYVEDQQQSTTDPSTTYVVDDNDPNNGNGNTSNNTNTNTNTTNDDNVQVVDKDKVNSVKLINNPANEPDPTGLDASKNAVDEIMTNKDYYGTIENPKTGAIISIIIILVIIIALIIAIKINKKKNKTLFKI